MTAVMIQKDKQPSNFQLISPNLWQGEVDCVIGPFSSKVVAEYFVGHMMKFGQLCDLEEIIFAKRDAWYIEARGLPDKKMVSPNIRGSEAPAGRSQ
jgi:hypothetical protein